MSSEEILAQVLSLSRAERAKVIGDALSSLEEPEEVVTRAWAAELERRSLDLSEGRVEAVTWEAARDEILGELEARRAGRSSP